MTHRRRLIVAVVAAGLVVLGASPAAADPVPSPTTTDPGSDAGPYCVVELTHGDLSGGPVTCFDNFPDAIARATGGAYTDAPELAVEALDSATFTDRLDSLAASVHTGLAIVPVRKIVIGIEYEHRDFEGLHVIFSGNAVCDEQGTPFDYGTPDLRTALPGRPGGANDMISSFRTFAGCAARHYEHVNYEGEVLPLRLDTSYVSDGFNDISSAIHWT